MNKPKIEIVVHRHPDYANTYTVFVDGVQLSSESSVDVTFFDIDPASGYSVVQWARNRAEAMRSTTNPAVATYLGHAYDDETESAYIEGDADLYEPAADAFEQDPELTVERWEHSRSTV